MPWVSKIISYDKAAELIKKNVVTYYHGRNKTEKNKFILYIHTKDAIEVLNCFSTIEDVKEYPSCLTKIGIGYSIDTLLKKYLKIKQIKQKLNEQHTN